MVGRSVAIKPDKHEAWKNWGNALSAQAKKKSGKEAERLRALARDQLEAARRIRSDDAEELSKS